MVMAKGEKSRVVCLTNQSPRWTKDNVYDAVVWMEIGDDQVMYEITDDYGEIGHPPPGWFKPVYNEVYPWL
jgi:hypothetical protein